MTESPRGSKDDDVAIVGIFHPEGVMYIQDRMMETCLDRAAWLRQVLAMHVYKGIYITAKTSSRVMAFVTA